MARTVIQIIRELALIDSTKYMTEEQKTVAKAPLKHEMDELTGQQSLIPSSPSTAVAGTSQAKR